MPFATNRLIHANSDIYFSQTRRHLAQNTLIRFDFIHKSWMLSPTILFYPYFRPIGLILQKLCSIYYSNSMTENYWKIACSANCVHLHGNVDNYISFQIPL